MTPADDSPLTPRRAPETRNPVTLRHPRSALFGPDSRVVGEPSSWAADLALVGAVTAPTSLAVWTASVSILPMLAFALTGGVTGALLGHLVPRLLHYRVRRVPVPLLLGAGLGVGANWGALVYAAPLIAVAGVIDYRALGAAAAVGMLQLGWFWLPYVLRKSRGESTFTLVIAACAASPVIAALAYLHAFVAGTFS